MSADTPLARIQTANPEVWKRFWTLQKVLQLVNLFRFASKIAQRGTGTTPTMLVLSIQLSPETV
jgi:hypothetical protein